MLVAGALLDWSGQWPMVAAGAYCMGLTDLFV